MIYVSILAAGKNIGNDQSKLPLQFTLLGSKPIIIHTLEKFVIESRIDRIIVVVTNEWVVYTEELIKKWISVPKEIHVIPGGINKNSSIHLAATYINEQWGTDDEDIILNHDAIRPFVTHRIINDNIESAKKNKVSNTVVPTVDTIAVSDNCFTINTIPPKSKMYSEQTPQTFNLKLLIDEYNKVPVEDIEKENDTARFMLNAGHMVYFVLGEYSNIKIITTFDLEVAKAFLRRSEDDKQNSTFN